MDGRKKSISWLGLYRCWNYLYDYIRYFLLFTQMLENVSSFPTPHQRHIFEKSPRGLSKFSDDPLQSQIHNAMEVSQRSTTA